MAQGGWTEKKQANFVGHVEFKLGKLPLKTYDDSSTSPCQKHHKFIEIPRGYTHFHYRWHREFAEAENTMRFLFIVAFLDSQLMAFAVEATVLMQSRPGMLWRSLESS